MDGLRPVFFTKSGEVNTLPYEFHFHMGDGEVRPKVKKLKKLRSKFGAHEDIQGLYLFYVWLISHLFCGARQAVAEPVYIAQLDFRKKLAVDQSNPEPDVENYCAVI